MNKVLLIALCIGFLAAAAPASAAGRLYVDVDGICANNSPCFTHPQDAVNASSPGDTILVYPGTYGSRIYTNAPPHWAPNDQYAPALIVYKDGLTIKAVHRNPSRTVIETTHDWWSNPVAIQASTGGVWNGTQYVGAGVYPDGGTAPNAVAIIASGVTIQGFTLRKPNVDPGLDGFFNTAGVMIGGLFSDDSDHLGASGNAVKDCAFEDVWHAVYIWHSSGNQVVNNDVAPLGATAAWAGISIYDGFTDTAVALGYPSQDNRIVNNRLPDKGIYVGASGPGLTLRTDNSGTKVHANLCTILGTTYSVGDKMFSGNKVLDDYYAFQAEGYKFPGKSNHAPPAGWAGYEPTVYP